MAQARFQPDEAQRAKAAQGKKIQKRLAELALRATVAEKKHFQAVEALKIKEAQGKKIQKKLAELAVALVKSRNAELAAVKELASVEARHRAELQSQIWDRGKETMGRNERVGK